ncbi:YybS family protein [Marinococcus sp. PL1-022]|uniref:YybS family protein n=1 Tax=Marinococcus sp. PL1-022 TaxID=3095363 RepID=UPI0029C10639|nr:YybS family protein [Marinococcus sp. PL1-022]MDX6154338.1 YybS family protein [Marinococcus sp. PL1-022]
MKNARSVAEAAVFSAVFLVLVLLLIFVPVVGSILTIAMPLPFIIFVARNGWKPGIFMFIVCALLATLFTGGIGFPTALIFGLGGIAAGALIHQKKPAFAVFAAGTVAYIIGLVLFYLSSILLFNIDPIQLIQQTLNDSISQARSMMESIGQDTSNLDALAEMVTLIQYIGPVLLIGTGIILSFITQVFAHVILKRVRMDYQQFPAFRNWSFPRSLIWYYLTGSIFILIGLEEGTAMYIVVMNLFPLLELAVAIQGFTVIFYFLHAKSYPKYYGVLIIVGSILLSTIALFLARILGIIDLGLNLKQRIQTDTK